MSNPVVPGLPVTVATKTVGGAERQRILVSPGAGTGAAPTRAVLPAADTNPFQAVPPNAARLKVEITVDETSTANLYMLEGDSTITTTPGDYDVILGPGDSYESDAGFAGQVQCIWSAAPGGVAVSREYVE